MKINTKAALKTVSIIAAAALLLCGCGQSEFNNDYYTNSLSDTVDFVPYFKDGDIFYYRNGEKIRVAENAYDENDDSPIYTADYAIDKNSGEMLYLTDGELFLFDGEKTERLAQNVTGWRAQEGFNAFLFTVPWQENIDEALGMLFLYKDGIATLLDTGIMISSIQIEEKCAYALKPNVYPETRNRLIKYDFEGNQTVLAESRPQIMWASDDCVVSAESSDGKIYTYYLDTEKKSVTVERVYLPSAAGNTLYLLQGYYNANGAVYAYDLTTLKSTMLAKNVSFFSTEAVTNPKKGIAYTVLDDEDNGYYSVYYCSVKGESKRIIHNTKEDALSAMALNNDLMEGFVYSSGKTKADSAVYFIDFKKDVTSTRIASGYVGGLCYYEFENKAVYLKTDGTGVGTLYVADGENSVALCENCAAENDSAGLKAQGVINKSADKAMYFSDLDEEEYGTLCLSDGTVISDRAMRNYGSAPIADSNFENIYYLTKNDDGTSDFYLFNGENVLIEENVQAIISVK